MEDTFRSFFRITSLIIGTLAVACIVENLLLKMFPHHHVTFRSSDITVTLPRTHDGYPFSIEAIEPTTVTSSDGMRIDGMSAVVLRPGEKAQFLFDADDEEWKMLLVQ